MIAVAAARRGRGTLPLSAGVPDVAQRGSRMGNESRNRLHRSAIVLFVFLTGMYMALVSGVLTGNGPPATIRAQCGAFSASIQWLIPDFVYYSVSPGAAREILSPCRNAKLTKEDDVDRALEAVSEINTDLIDLRCSYDHATQSWIWEDGSLVEESLAPMPPPVTMHTGDQFSVCLSKDKGALVACDTAVEGRMQLCATRDPLAARDYLLGTFWPRGNPFCSVHERLPLNPSELVLEEDAVEGVRLFVKGLLRSAPCVWIHRSLKSQTGTDVVDLLGYQSNMALVSIHDIGNTRKGQASFSKILQRIKNARYTGQAVPVHGTVDTVATEIITAQALPGKVAVASVMQTRLDRIKIDSLIMLLYLIAEGGVLFGTGAADQGIVTHLDTFSESIELCPVQDDDKEALRALTGMHFEEEIPGILIADDTWIIPKRACAAP